MRASRRYPRLPGEWNDLIVVWGSAAWDATRLGSQSLAEALSADHPVLYVDPPASLARLAREGRVGDIRGPRLQLLAPGLARLTPLGPPGTSRIGPYFGVARTWMGPAIRRAVATLGGSVRAVLTGYVVYDPFGLCGERYRVFRASDDFAAGADLIGVGAERLQRLELDLARRADLVVCVSPPLVDKWRALGFDPVLVPNGCDTEHFATARVAEAPADIVLPRPIVGISGQVSKRIDLRLLDEIAERGRSLLIVGRLRPDLPEASIAALLDRPNVQWVGFRPYLDLPAYLGAMDVGLVPYTASGFNRSSFPLKILEYLAAGLPVVSTDLPSVRWLDTDLVRIAEEPAAFADAVDDALAEAGDADAAARRMAFAAGHSWRSRAADYDAALAALADP